MSFDPTIRPNSLQGYHINTSLVAREKAEEITRMKVELPVRKEYKSQWEALGIEWVSSIEGDPFVATAKLPVGWTVRENFVSDFDKKDFLLVDDKGMPRASIWMKMAFYDQKAQINILSEVDASELYQKYQSQSELDKQFQKLLREYQHVLRSTVGCGSRVQPDIDRVWNKLNDFASDHPEFAMQVPIKQVARDDGSQGLFSGLVIMTNEMRKDENQECVIQ